MSILLVSDLRIAELNRIYRRKSEPTNVLAFPMREGDDEPMDNLLGDVVISVDTAARESQIASVSVQRRITELLVHGLLHLLGYDHERSDNDAKLMKIEEDRLLNNITSF